MPLPALLPAAITAGAGLLSSGLNVWSQNKTNQEQENFSREMYEKQRADNERQWHLQNEYNSPMSQMNRLREAGLNPNLVYGKGADNISAPMPNVNPSSYSPNAPQYDLLGPVSSGLDSYFNYQLKDAQINNLKTQNTVNEQEAILKAAHIASVQTNTARSAFELDKASELRQNSLDMAAESLRQLQANTNFQLAENERRLITTSQGVLESAERILNMRAERANTKAQYDQIRAQITSLRNDNELKRLDIQLRQNGVMPHDPIYMRALGRLLGTGYGSLFDNFDKKTRQISKDFKGGISDYLNQLFQ